MEPDIYVYKIVTDNGGAPCVWRGLLSLALCKPKIRKFAKKGDLVFGFGGKAYNGKLIYIAEVTEKPPVGDYYRLSRFTTRPDCIYKEVVGRSKRRKGARFHAGSDERATDVGAHFEKAHVLLSREFRYLGGLGNTDYASNPAFAEVKRLVKEMTRGHRVKHSPCLREQLLELKKRMWREHRKTRLGNPTESDVSRRCNSETASLRC